ncbi:MAG: hypothetical protein L6Q71_04390, partial [Planctomycetes bacterium]|nr:hypothetical protein [Planctomycetota bacterium]
KQTQEQIASSQAHIAALKDMTDKQADSIKSLEHDNAELRKSQETLKKETQEKLDKMRKMQETQDERIKRMERLLGLEAEN